MKLEEAGAAGVPAGRPPHPALPQLPVDLSTDLPSSSAPRGRGVVEVHDARGGRFHGAWWRRSRSRGSTATRNPSSTSACTSPCCTCTRVDRRRRGRWCRRKRGADAMASPDPSVSAAYYYVCSQYHKAKQEFAEFYCHGMLYLAFVSSESSRRRRVEISRPISPSPRSS